MNQQPCADEEPNCAKSFSDSIILPRDNFFKKCFFEEKRTFLREEKKLDFLLPEIKVGSDFSRPECFGHERQKHRSSFRGASFARARVRERGWERAWERVWESERERGKGGGKKSEFEDSGWERVKEWVSKLEGVREGLREWKEIEKRYKRDNKRGEKKTFGERG